MHVGCLLMHVGIGTGLQCMHLVRLSPGRHRAHPYMHVLNDGRHAVVNNLPRAHLQMLVQLLQRLCVVALQADLLPQILRALAIVLLDRGIAAVCQRAAAAVAQPSHIVLIAAEVLCHCKSRKTHGAQPITLETRSGGGMERKRQKRKEKGLQGRPAGRADASAEPLQSARISTEGALCSRHGARCAAVAGCVTEEQLAEGAAGAAAGSKRQSSPAR
eukprot:349654-Chlamydomonas_euryale.AAC.1